MLAVTQSPHSDTGSDRPGALSLSQKRQNDDGLMKYAANVCLGQQQANGIGHFSFRVKNPKGPHLDQIICHLQIRGRFNSILKGFISMDLHISRNDRCGDEVN
jgi:hypothetical protein